MITEYDTRVNNGDFEGFRKTAKKALKHIREHFMDYAQAPDIRGYSHRFSPYTLRDEFDRLISQDGFEIDARSIKHAYGIGNNNEWDILDKNMNKVGTFNANNNMYHGVYLNVYVKDKRLDGFEICSGGFIRE